MKKNKLVFITLLILLNLIAFSKDLYGQNKVKYYRSIHVYNVPEITLLNQDNQKVTLPNLLKQNNVVILDFIYATCKTVCPVLSANFANFQYKLGAESKKIELVSITIDPEHDSVSILNKYLKRYRAVTGWNFLTGTPDNIYSVMKVFSAYTEEKMGFYPIVFIYSPKNKHWIQLEGAITSKELIDEYQKVLVE